MRFYSDNTATLCPELLQALQDANHGHARGYGDDDWTRRLDDALGRHFETEVKVFVVLTGTAANALSLATLVPPYGAIFAHEEAHVLNDECGAPEFYTHGARVVGLHGANGKLTPDALEEALRRQPASGHSLKPTAVSLTQATEVGTSYRPEEIAAVAELAHRRNLHVHLDGARFANAVAFLGCSPADLTWRAGVDVMSFGATKNGGLAAEAVVFFNHELVRDFELRRKRAGHLLSKSRYISAQLLAYVETDVWLRNASRANALARQIAGAVVQSEGVKLLYPVEANELFLRLGEDGKTRLRSLGFEFYDWGPANEGLARLVVSWDQAESDVDALCAALLNRSSAT